MVDVDIEEVGQVAPGTPLPPWSTRIPAAIKEAEELIGPDDWYENDANTVVVTAGELELAKALWEAEGTCGCQSPTRYYTMDYGDSVACDRDGWSRGWQNDGLKAKNDDVWCGDCTKPINGEVPPALIAFAEKVENLP